jgi:hypothetical protein
MLEVTAAQYVDPFCIRIRFNDGDEGVVDLGDALWGPKAAIPPGKTSFPPPSAAEGGGWGRESRRGSVSGPMVCRFPRAWYDAHKSGPRWLCCGL